jgi:methionyl-tRNA formyltransferase
MIIFLGNSHSLNLYKDLIEASKKDSPDIVVSCQYPHLIPESLIKSHTCINIHYGKLPEYAGCNPIYWQLLQEYQAGVTIHYVDKTFDSGDIIASSNIPCGNLTADECYEALAQRGMYEFSKVYKSILNGTAPRFPQDLSKRKYYNKSDVNFNHAKHVPGLYDRLIRAVSFKGKQAPIVKVGQREYKLEAV